MILCLLVACKVFTQTDTQITKPEYVFLTEAQARLNIKELIAYDGLKLISAEQENRITNFQSIVAKYETVVITKDSIIGKKDNIIDLQDKIINAKKPLEFHAYGGARTYNFEFDNPIFYGRAQLEFSKINIGGQINFQPVVPDSSVDGFYYNIYIEYKIF